MWTGQNPLPQSLVLRSRVVVNRTSRYILLDPRGFRPTSHRQPSSVTAKPLRYQTTSTLPSMEMGHITSLTTSGTVGSRFVTQDELDDAKKAKEDEWKAAYER